MYVLNTINDYDNNTDLNITENCTINAKNVYIFIPTLLLTIPCGLSFLCSMSLMIFTLIKTLINIR